MGEVAGITEKQAENIDRFMSVLPQHKTDTFFRVFNTDRYDDRDVVITNLIESYDRLIAFGQKHLNDTFHLDGIQSVSARDHILREIVSNLLVHRDFSNAYVAKLVIEKQRVFTENANLSHGHGALSLASFGPYPKNPPIYFLMATKFIFFPTSAQARLIRIYPLHLLHLFTLTILETDRHL